MDNSISTKSIWDLASKAGLALGGVSIAYLVLTQYCMPSSEKVGMSMLISLLSLVLWAGKFAGCIWLMRFFMKKLAADYSDTTNSDTFKFGMWAALLSALIYSGFYLLYTTVLAPDTFAETVSMLQDSYASILPQESIDAMGEVNLSQLTFFTNLIYCFLFGTILSAILSRKIPARDPFADYKEQDSEQN